MIGPMEPDEPKSEKSRRDWEMEEQAYYEQEESIRIADEERIAEEREAAIESMVGWFFENFEDPQNEGHYDSEDGVYLYPYGGPFDAADILSSFSDDYPNEEWIKEAVERIERNGTYEWAPTSNGEFYEHPEEDIDLADSTVASALDKSDAIKILLAKVDRLEQRLDEIVPVYGHNGPPNDIGVPPYDNEDQKQLRDLVSVVRNELSKTIPDTLILNEKSEKAASIGAKILGYAAKTADTTVQEATKTVAKYGTLVGLAQLAGFDVARFGVELVNLASDIISFVSKFVMP